MHFWIETVDKKSQEALPILKAMARMLYELYSLQYLILVFHILLTECHGFKGSQHLKDMNEEDLFCDCTPPDCQHDLVPPEPGGKAAVQKAGFGGTSREG